jgi:hypothetical protein
VVYVKQEVVVRMTMLEVKQRGGGGRVNLPKVAKVRCAVLDVEEVHPSTFSTPQSHLTLPSITMPYISTEALVGAGLLVVLAVGYQYLPLAASSGSANSKKNKKNKKKSKGVATTNEPQLSSVPLPSAPVSEKAENGVKGTAKPIPIEPLAKTPESTPQPAQPASVPKPKTLAEKIAPQPRKTKVDE